MKITESRLRRIIREELLSEARKLPPVETFLRFGDPRAVKDGVSVIHDPIAYAYAEEPALYGIGDGESYNLRSEAGISAYPVVEDGNTITFKVGNGIGPFSGQLGNFLLDRLMAGDVWVFKARRIPSMALGTDSEPLIDGSTVKSVRKVDTSSLRVTDRSSGGGERLLDLLDPWDLDGYLNMGYNEFFKTQDIPREKITDFLGSLKARFSTPKQLRVLEKIEEIWLDDWDEDHLSKSGRGITESRLHKLLREAAMTPGDAAKNGITFEVQSFLKSVEISAFKDGNSIATLEAEYSRDCDAWPVSKAFSDVNGLGPLLYDLLMDIVHPEPITSDRELVTPAARAVWEYYFSRRPDIEKVDLPEKCPQDSAERHLGDDLWRESPLSKGYKRRDGSDYLVLGALRKMGIIEGYD